MKGTRNASGLSARVGRSRERASRYLDLLDPYLGVFPRDASLSAPSIPRRKRTGDKQSRPGSMAPYGSSSGAIGGGSDVKLASRPSTALVERDPRRSSARRRTVRAYAREYSARPCATPANNARYSLPSRDLYHSRPFLAATSFSREKFLLALLRRAGTIASRLDHLPARPACRFPAETWQPQPGGVPTENIRNVTSRTRLFPISAIARTPGESPKCN